MMLKVNDVLSKLGTNGTLIGSRAWGFNTRSSDYDVVISRETFESIIKSEFRGYLLGHKGSGRLNRGKMPLLNDYADILDMYDGEVNLIVYDDPCKIKVWDYINKIMPIVNIGLVATNKYKIHRFVESTFQKTYNLLRDNL